MWQTWAYSSIVQLPKDLDTGKDKANPIMVLAEQMLNRKTIATSSCF